VQGLGCGERLSGHCKVVNIGALPAGAEQGGRLQALAAQQLAQNTDTLFFFQRVEELSASGLAVMLQLLGTLRSDSLTCTLATCT
jgi:hypothetical protein